MRRAIIRALGAALLFAITLVGRNGREHPHPTDGLPRAAAYSTVFVNAEGLDTCSFYMAAKWNTVYFNVSNLYGVGFYLGGITADSAGCYEATATWISNLTTGWKLEPIWDGLQAPCSANTHRMSSDGDVASGQGINAGFNAIDQAGAIGIPGGNIIYYDMEGYSSSCEGPVKRFVSGWVNVLHDNGYEAGLYGSVCDAPLDDYFGIANPPDDIVIAQWNNDDSGDGVNTSCISHDHWTNRRLHQYTRPISYTAGGVTLDNVDKDCVRGELDGHSSFDGACG